MDPPNILAALVEFLSDDSFLMNKFFPNTLSKETLNEIECEDVITKLTELLWNEKYTLKIADLFSPLLLEFLCRIRRTVDRSATYDDVCMDNRHKWLSIALSKLIWFYPEVERFTRTYLEESRNFFRRSKIAEPPPNKRLKVDICEPSSCNLLKAAYLLLLYDTAYFRDTVAWSEAVKFLADEDFKTRWYAYKCLACVGNIKEDDLSSILKIKESFTDQELTICAKEEIELNLLWNRKSSHPLKASIYKDGTLNDTVACFCTQTVSIYGVLLNKMPANQNPKTASDIQVVSELVCVDSVKQALHSTALAISSAEPILIQGPVGCGKTSLVEHLAMLTKRKPLKNFIKLQLGDHVDSKMLLGTHCCTEIPGQFVWKPGIIVKAMTHGHWLLLEDIDCAPMDVISLLVSLLQTKTIVLPGHSSAIKAAPGFQLFATQRLLSGLDGSYLEFKNNGQVIDGLWRKVQVNSLSEDELTKVITIKWPTLSPIVQRILEVYALFSPDAPLSEVAPFSPQTTHGRYISKRDLFKFCARIALNFDNSQAETAKSVFMHALQCFCDCISNPQMRQSAAEQIAVIFNFSKSEARYTYQNYKPNISKGEHEIVVGTTRFPRKPSALSFIKEQKSVFAHTRLSTTLLEKVTTSVKNKEPVLLVGETGTGKTSIVQYLAELTNQKLTVINMSQQSDSVDLIGGYKPVDFKFNVEPIKNEFEELFLQSMKREENADFLKHVASCYYKRRYKELFELILHAQKNIVRLLSKMHQKSQQYANTIRRWKKLENKITHLKDQLQKYETMLAFKFIEGSLIKAMKNGEWLLLDEINLAEAETLECLAGILEKSDDTFVLLEKGDDEAVKRHPDFHIFACMNPATDVGKKDLPTGIRSRFTEFFVDEASEKTDLTILTQEYLKSLSLNAAMIDRIVDFYLYIREAAFKHLSDGTGHRPHYSLRTLCRALKHASKNPCMNIIRSLYEAFNLSFLSQLDNASHKFVSETIKNRLIMEKKSSIFRQSIPMPKGGSFEEIEGYWVMRGDQETYIDERYIFTETVKKNLQDLARVVSAGRYPVLLQGETSSGKTSLIQYLAKATGNVCIRVNNHEHTDIQEYVGTYSADCSGKLVFKEGNLVNAMRKGYWIILDELNLAPTEVMEALNRVLDDNRELFISETQTLVKAHPRFMIFATQNPPGHYGGRKLLSRAFRNRFIELHFNEIPPADLKVILEKRCHLSESYSGLLVNVMVELQGIRTKSRVFAGKQGLITLRDLFRWGERYQLATDSKQYYDWLQHLADEGYLLLAGRVRSEEEMEVIQNVLLKYLKRKPDPIRLFNLSEHTSPVTRDILETVLNRKTIEGFEKIVWTYNMRRLAVLVGKAVQFKEPALLIGHTGCGKTTLCHIYACLEKKELHSVNCHLHTESADFLGGLRPVRDLKERETKLFEWKEGPLIQSMVDGSFFLADEISLADDSVLERLNSVLEKEKKILLSEKSFDDCIESEIKATDGFQFLATMNPGGDYGKKELSPALRNRFIEIWCPSNVLKDCDVIDIVEHNLIKELQQPRTKFPIGEAFAGFLNYFSQSFIGQWCTITLRDVMTWVEFINATIRTKTCSVYDAYCHGAFLVFLDSAGMGHSANISYRDVDGLKGKCLKFLSDQTGNSVSLLSAQILLPEIYPEEDKILVRDITKNNSKPCFAVGPFDIKKGPSVDRCEKRFVFGCKTVKANAMRIIRAMQLSKPILLEGSPGVGKTSLVDAISQASGHKLVRINLSEQTDISDLFGADLPVDGGKTGEFSWRNGPFLQALQDGHWILLDELNLASQTVLEGLNACLDHRSIAQIPELGITIKMNKSTSRIFGCQNPYQQGGSRKGLPRSFLNRFTQVFMRPMGKDDLVHITTNTYPSIPAPLVEKMIQFNQEVSVLEKVHRKIGCQGGPFEFNLRDIFRMCEAILHTQLPNALTLAEFVHLVYGDRMRSKEEKKEVVDLYLRIMQFHEKDNSTRDYILNRYLDFNVYKDSLQLGNATISRNCSNVGERPVNYVPVGYLPVLESIMKCIEMNWMPILIGPSGSGKSSLIRLLAELSGNKLHVMSVNSEMDTIELLGGFEQVDVKRKLKCVAQDLELVTQEAILQCLKSQTLDLEEILRHAHVCATIKRNGSAMNIEDMLEILHKLVKALEKLEITKEKAVLERSTKILQELNEKKNSGELVTGGQFEWVDSILVQAAIQGHWLLIDDANFCSPSVLDRLNALLEPNGTLLLSEQGAQDDGLRVIKPHPQFRLFLTMDPHNGEISRAMRNRGIEIYVEPLDSDKAPWRLCMDRAAFSSCKGLLHPTLEMFLASIHDQLAKSKEHCAKPSLSQFTSASSMLAQLMNKHEDIQSALLKTYYAVYANNCLSTPFRQAMDGYVQEMVKSVSQLPQDISTPVAAIRASSLDYRQNINLAAIKKSTGVLTYYLNIFKGFEKTPNVSFLSHYPAVPEPDRLIRERLFCIVRLLSESSSVQTSSLQSIPLLNIWLQSHLEEMTKDASPQLGNIIRESLLLKNALDAEFRGPIVAELLGTVDILCNRATVGATEVNIFELPIDPRWTPNVYRRLIYLSKRFSDMNEFDNHTDMLDLRISEFGDKFSLLLLLRSLEFTLSLKKEMSINHCALVQTEKIAQILGRDKKHYAEAVRLIPSFLETFSSILLNILEESAESKDIDDSYWQLQSILMCYYGCRETCVSPIQHKDVHEMVSVFITNFYMLWKRVRIFQHPKTEKEKILENAFESIDRFLLHKDPIKLFRKKFIKPMSIYLGFCSEHAVVLNNSVQDLYDNLDPLRRLISTHHNVEHLNIIMGNSQMWMEILIKESIKCAFSATLPNIPDYQGGVEKIIELNKGFVVKGILQGAENCNDIVQLPNDCHISNDMFNCKIQLLPLLDYVFTINFAELISVKPINISDELCHLAENYLYINPRTLALLNYRINRQDERDIEAVMVPLLASFFSHQRDSYSSKGLHLLKYAITEPDSTNTQLQNSDSSSPWCKQSALLTHICANLLDPVHSHCPLRMYQAKIAQLQSIKDVLWSNFNKIGEKLLSYRYINHSILLNWFKFLIVRVGQMVNSNLLDITSLYHNLEKIKATPLITTKNGIDIFNLSFNTMAALEADIKKISRLHLDENFDETDSALLTAKAYVYMGLLTTMLLKPIDLMDPVEEQTFKLKALDKNLQDVQVEIEIRDWMCKVNCGQGLDEIAPLDCPPHVHRLDSIRHNLQMKMRRISQKIMCRVKSKNGQSGFDNLKETINANMKMPDYTLDLINQLEQIFKSNNINKESKILLKAKNEAYEQKRFVEKIKKDFPLYEDVTLPFVVGVEQIIYGLELFKQCILVKEINQKFIQQSGMPISDFLTQFVTFQNSISEPEAYAIPLRLLKRETIKSFRYLMFNTNQSPQLANRAIYNLVKSAILEIIGEARTKKSILGSCLPDSAAGLLFPAFFYFWKLWDEQDSKIRAEKEEEESLYKVKHHKGELSEEEAMQQQLESVFPSFEKEFEDCKPKDVNAYTSDIPVEHSPSDLHLTPENMFEVWRLHATVLATLTGTDLPCRWVILPERESDLIAPYLLRQQVILSLVKSMPEIFDVSMDQKLAIWFLPMCQELQKPAMAELDIYDIYHDPNVMAVLELQPVLKIMEDRVKKLLKLSDFHNHSQLTLILKIVSRVLSFPITDPLMKFVIGMELIIDSIQLWEKLAHRGISLKAEADELTQKIIKYRSLELDGWKKGLESVIRKQYVNSSKWWFLMFDLFNSMVKSPENSENYDRVIRGLKQCLEDSTLGEFPARLSILHTFMLQAKLMSKVSHYRKLAQMLFNMYTYFNQFSQAIQNHISQIRKPIEKDMKEYVKIVRWKDINYFSLKASVEKSHRTIIKHIKAFEDALRLKAKDIFTIPSKKDLDTSDQPLWKLHIKTEFFLIKENSEALICAVGARSEPLLKKLPHFHAKAQLLAKRIAKKIPVINSINTLNKLCGTVIESLESVVQDSGKKMCTRSQEKSSVLQTIQLKKLMLSTLFKNLRAIGLSYRKGLVSSRNENQNDILTVPAFDVKQLEMLSFDGPFKELLEKSSEDTVHYFYKSIAQYFLLQSHMTKPHKDLNLDIVHRIHGYSGHLLSCVKSQKHDIVRLAQNVDTIGCLVGALSEMTMYTEQEEIAIIPPQKEVLEIQVILSNTVSCFMCLIAQFDSLWNTAPETGKGSRGAIPKPHFNREWLSSVGKPDAFWGQMKSHLTQLTNFIKKWFQEHTRSTPNSTNTTFKTWGDIKDIQDTFSFLDSSVASILSLMVSAGFKQREPQHCFQEFWEELKKVIKIYSDAFQVIYSESEMVDDTPSSDVPENRKMLRVILKLVKEMLLGFQGVVASCLQVGLQDASSDNLFPTNLFTTEITDYLGEFEKALRIQEVAKLMHKLKKMCLKRQNSTDDVKARHNSFRLVIHLTPFLKQYFQLVKVHFAASLGMHRTTCKFLSILLQIFNLLASEGFCIPPELQEESEKSGATKFEDIESGGLGEGEGTKDVSGTIETEDQLEDAFKEGQEKEEKKEEQPDLKEEKDGIEMSDDFEGKSYDPEANDDESQESEPEDNEEELDKQMGDVDGEDVEKLDEKVWGSDSEDEKEDLEDESGSGGMQQNNPSELVAKDGMDKDNGTETTKQQSDDLPPDDQTDEYQGEVPDPMIDAPPDEPEYVELPDDMEITDDVDKDEGGDLNDSVDTELNPDDDAENKEDTDEDDIKNEEGEDETSEKKDEGEEIPLEKDMEGKSAEPVQQNDEDDLGKNEACLPTHTPTLEPQALPSADEHQSSSHDPVKDEALMEWESAAQRTDEQHKEGQADSKESYGEDAAHEGKKSSSSQKTHQELQSKPKLRSPAEKRTLDDSADTANAKRRPIADKQSLQNTTGSEDPEDNADAYEHVENSEDGTSQAVDVASEEQARMKPSEAQNSSTQDDGDDDVIELSSDDEEEYVPKKDGPRSHGDVPLQDERRKPGDRGNYDNNENLAQPEGDLVVTHSAARGDSTIHTQHDLWSSLKSIHMDRVQMGHRLEGTSQMGANSSLELWRDYEMVVARVAPELCEQLRLVLEPTKMSKLKGDYRTGKRLNMRKIIPYIASQFRKDKIWLRRTKPSKREYQIMLAVDDSSSMSDNHSKKLAFESLAVLGHSLNLLESGELSVIRFGETVDMLVDFNQQFSIHSASHIYEQFTFNQVKTSYVRMLQSATAAMVQARTSSAMRSKETAQLLVILSDGRGVFSEGEEAVKAAVRLARSHNIFMVFLIFDNPASKDSILDLSNVTFIDNKPIITPYLEKFPFPFYVILRDIYALPLVLGEALRQWFELVTVSDL